MAAPGAPAGEVAFWSCASERAQAQAVAAEVERLISREDVAPEDVCVLVRSVRAEGQAVAVAFEERAVPYHLSGAAAFFQRAEVRDLLAWLRLLVDPGDAGAVVRALARSPVELRAIDLARVTQIARRRKLDMVAALERRAGVAADPARGARADRRLPQALPQPPPRALDSSRPDLYVHRLVERLGLRRQLLFAATDRGRRAAAQPGALRRARRRLRAPRAAGHGARVRALDRRRRRRRPARGGGRRRRAPARRARDDDARRQGPRVRPRLRARPDERADAGPAAADARADPRRADQGDRPAALAQPRTRPRCGGCCTSR